MSPFSSSSLFREANRELQQLARQAFSSTQVGQIVSGAVRAAKQSSSASSDIRRQLEVYSRLGTRQALQAIAGTELGELARSVERYARKPSLKRLLGEFLGGLGPEGKLIQALIGGGASGTFRDELKVMADVLSQFGYEVRPPQQGASDLEKDVAAAEWLKARGWQAVPPGQQQPGVKPPKHPRAFGEEFVQNETVEGPYDHLFADLPANHPANTGEAVETPASSNVYSVSYDGQSQILYIRFQAAHKGAPRGGPGPLYKYWPCLRAEFCDLYDHRDEPGEWVWDHLRIRGTFSGHQKNYELVGVMGGYVPRKAMMTFNPHTRQREEWFVKRTVTTLGGERLTSPLGTERTPWEPDRGSPDRGDRGSPDRGRD